jgi:Leucine-rich repeat (LRR) protein
MGNELSQHVEHAQKTGILQLRNFKLVKVPNEILPITHLLRNLDLSSNRLEQLPPELFKKMQLLKNLNLSANRLQSLPNEISLLLKLETLNLSENMLSRVPLTLNQLKNLKQINLSKNNLTQIPKELCEIEKLDHLDLSLNKIERVDDYVEKLNAIELNLNENRIKSISEMLAKCPRLKVVRLEQNLLELRAIPAKLLAESNVSLLNFEGNLFTQKQFEQAEGFEKVIRILFLKLEIGLCHNFVFLFGLNSIWKGIRQLGENSIKRIKL